MTLVQSLYNSLEERDWQAAISYLKQGANPLQRVSSEPGRMRPIDVAFRVREMHGLLAIMVYVVAHGYQQDFMAMMLRAHQIIVLTDLYDHLLTQGYHQDTSGIRGDVVRLLREKIHPQSSDSDDSDYADNCPDYYPVDYADVRVGDMDYVEEKISSSSMSTSQENLSIPTEHDGNSNSDGGVDSTDNYQVPQVPQLRRQGAYYYDMDADIHNNTNEQLSSTKHHRRNSGLLSKPAFSAFGKNGTGY